MLLIAPTEHDIQAILRLREIQFRISSLPEKHGCDIFSLSKAGVIGFQRKTLPDLNASLIDGRLNYEIEQITASATLAFSFLIIESTLARTVDGNCVEANIGIDTVRSIIVKCHARGIGYLPCSNPDDTIRAVENVTRYITSPTYNLTRRPKQLKNEWGQVTSESYALFLLQSFPGIGPKQARAILDHFPLFPIAWTVSAADLAEIPGIGLKTAERLIAALAPVAP